MLGKLPWQRNLIINLKLHHFKSTCVVTVTMICLRNKVFKFPLGKLPHFSTFTVKEVKIPIPVTGGHLAGDLTYKIICIRKIIHYHDNALLLKNNHRTTMATNHCTTHPTPVSTNNLPPRYPGQLQLLQPTHPPPPTLKQSP